MRDHSFIPLSFQNCLRFLYPRRQFNWDKPISNFDGKCHTMYLAIVTILKRNMFCAVRSERLL
jgi:hypothetical protein